MLDSAAELTFSVKFIKEKAVPSSINEQQMKSVDLLVTLFTRSNQACFDMVELDEQFYTYIGETELQKQGSPTG
jgi:hypothetical protein